MKLKKRDVKSRLSIDDITKMQMDLDPISECMDSSICAITDSIIDESFPITIRESFSSDQDNFKHQRLKYSSQNWILSNPNIQFYNETPGFRSTAPSDLMIGGILPSSQSIQDNNQKLNITDNNTPEKVTCAHILADNSETNSQIFQHSYTANTTNVGNINRKSSNSFNILKASHYEEHHRREYHIASERKRRRKLQEAFTYLSSLLYYRDYPVTRMVILDTAIETIKILKAELDSRNTLSE